MKSKKDRKFVVINPGDWPDEIVFGVALDGSVHILNDISDTKQRHWESEKRVLTAHEANLVGLESEHRAKMHDEMPCESETGYGINVHDDGDVEIGCQHYSVEQVTRVVALSRRLAAANKRKR